MIDIVIELLQSLEKGISHKEVEMTKGSAASAALYAYPEKYRGARPPIKEQVRILCKLIPWYRRLVVWVRKILTGKGYADLKLAERPLPEGAEGWFAVLRWQAIARTYGRAVVKVLKRLRSKDWHLLERTDEPMTRPLHETTRSIKFWRRLRKEQKGYDILIIAAQFGMLHRGESTCQTRNGFLDNEFGLGTFAVRCMLLTHPERILRHRDLGVGCAGDEDDTFYTNAPYAFYFSFSGNKIGLFSGPFDSAFPDIGSASAFLPSSM